MSMHHAWHLIGEDAPIVLTGSTHLDDTIQMFFSCRSAAKNWACSTLEHLSLYFKESLHSVTSVFLLAPTCQHLFYITLCNSRRESSCMSAADWAPPAPPPVLRRRRVADIDLGRFDEELRDFGPCDYPSSRAAVLKASARWTLICGKFHSLHVCFGLWTKKMFLKSRHWLQHPKRGNMIPCIIICYL